MKLNSFNIIEISTNSFAEYKNIRKKIRSYSNDSMGVNFTGGTKLMVYNVLRALEGRTNRTIYSYLDASSNHLLIEVREETGEIRHRSIDLSSKTLPLIDLLTLHFLKTPKVTMNGHGNRLKQTAEVICSIVYERPEIYMQFKNNYIRPIMVNHRSTKKHKILFSGQLEQLRHAMAKDLGRDDIPESIEVASMYSDCGFETMRDFIKWFDGGWLETLVYHILLDSKSTLNIFEMGSNLEVTPSGGTKFELDVFAIIGARFFAISCTTAMALKEGKKKNRESNRGGTKKKLFEVAQRALQIGGGEARYALVSLFPEPDSIKNEVFSSVVIRKDKILVTGKNDLPNLKQKLIEWMKGR